MSVALGLALGGEFHLPEAGLRVCTWTDSHTTEAKKHDPSLCSIRHPPKNPPISKALAQGRQREGLVCTEPHGEKFCGCTESSDGCENLAP